MTNPTDGRDVQLTQHKRPRVAFLFSAFGSSSPHAGSELYASFPVFREAVDRCARLSPDVGLSVVSAIGRRDQAASAPRPALPQLFALQSALVDLWRSWGISAEVAIGYGAGELAAAYAAGVLSFEDAWHLAVRAAGLAHDVGSGGRLAVVDLEPDAATAQLEAAGLASDIAIAAVHGNGELVLSGTDRAMQLFCQRLESSGHRVTWLAATRAWHSPKMQALTEPLVAELQRMSFGRAQIGLASSYFGRVLPRRREDGLDRDYLARLWSAPVRFREAFIEVNGLGYNTFVEIGAGTGLLDVCRALRGDTEATWVASVAESGERDAILEGLRVLDRAGANVSWSKVPDGDGQREERRKGARPPLAEALADASIGERLELLRAQIRNQVGRVLGLAQPKPLQLDQPFRDLGLDSMMTVDLWVRISKDIGRQLDPDLAFQYPSINALADYLAREQFPSRRVVDVLPREKREDETIAIVGMACRFPGGADSPTAFWELLKSGADAVSEVPDDRWDVRALYDQDPSAAGKTITRWGGFLRDVDRFDAAFFSISPREALSMDPQQRLLLETSWEAMEAAGHSPQLLRGSDTAVYVGVTYADYYQRWGTLAEKPERYDLYAATGNTNAMTAGRLSYFFDFRGPALALDTACSSSLVALHLAASTLRSGQSSLAIVAGVNLILSPETTVNFSRGRMMSPDGRCKTFDARANGYVRAEGCAAIVVKRYRDAVRDGDNILAIVRGTAVNHDGRSNGLTAPNGLAQQALIRSALADAKVAANEIDYVEAHGTGTPLGDPTELQALRAALTDAEPRRNPLLVGSVKTNIGHTEAAAGLAGLMKVVLAMQHEELPAHLHFEKLNPHIPSAGLPFEVVGKARPWARGGKRRLAGVSAFGFSGTNAHVVLEEAPTTDVPAPANERPLHLFTVSGRSDASLREAARRLAAHVKNSAAPLADVAFTSNTGRAHFEHRAAVVVASKGELADKLESLAAGQAADGVQHEALEAGADTPKVAFLFSGQASLYANAGKDLYATHPVFRAALDRCAEILTGHLDVALHDVLFPPDASRAQLLHETRYAQPALVSLEYALATLWTSFGVEPAAVLGHSIGEYAACAVADAVSLETVLPLVAKRGELMQAMPEGRMLAVFASLEATQTRLVRYGGKLAIAAINGPASVVVAGETEAVESLRAELDRDRVKNKPLDSKRAFHSPMLDPMLDALESAAAEIEVGQPRIPVVSNLRGTMYWRRRDELPNPSYWRRHAREPVQFAAGVRTLVEHGCTIFIEIGPRATLLGPAAESVDGAQFAWLPTLRQSAAPWAQLLEALAAAYAKGVNVNWRGFDAAYPRRRVALPTYAFQRQRFWIEPPPRTHPSSESKFTVESDHPLLGSRSDSPLGIVTFDGGLGGGRMGYLADHCVQDKVVFPGAGYLEMITAGAAAAAGAASWTVEDVRFVKALVLSEASERRVQLVFGQPTSGAREVQIASRTGDTPSWDGAAWTQHAAAKVRFGADDALPVDVPVLDSLRQRLTRVVDATAHYLTMTEMGLQYGPAFRAVQAAYHGEKPGEVLVRIAERVSAMADDGHTLHPAVVDACFQAFSAAGAAAVPGRGSFMPIGLERVAVRTSLRGAAWGYARIRQDGVSPKSKVLLGDCFLYDDTGALVASFSGLRSLRVEQLVVEDAPRDPRELIHEVKWRRAELSDDAKPAAGSWLVLCDRAGIGEALAAVLTAGGATVVKVHQGQQFKRRADGSYELRAAQVSDYEALFNQLGAGGASTGVVHLWSVDAGAATRDGSSFAGDESVGCHSALLLSQVAARRSGATRLTFVTAGAQPVGASAQSAVAVSQSATIGFARGAQWEHPELVFQRIDLPQSGDPMLLAEKVARELRLPDGEVEVIIRENGRFVPRLAQHAVTAPAKRFTIRPDASYVITGAFGGIGREVTRWLVERGAKHLLLLGRRGASESHELLEELGAAGVSVRVAAVDVADADALRSVLEEVKGAMPELRGVIHAAGIIDDGILLDQTWQRFAKVLAPKVTGAWNLHRQTVGTPLDFFVVFSSVSALWGAPGQTSYAAANAWLDALAQSRVAAGLPTTTIAWGPWSVGMAAGMGVKGARRYREQGLAMLSPREGLAALEHVLAHRLSHCSVFAVASRATLVEHHQAGFRSLFGDWRNAPPPEDGIAPPVEKKVAKAPSLLEQVNAAPVAQRLSVISDYLQRVVRKQLGVDASQHLSTQQPFMDMGLDSLMLSNLRRELMAGLGKSLPATIGFDYPTLEALVGYVAKDVMGIELTADNPAAPVSDGDDIAALLDKVSALSDSDAEALLAAKLGSGG